MPQNRKKEIDHRRAEISKLYLQGVTVTEIAEKVNVSKSQVSRDLKHLTQIWKASAMQDLDERKAKDLQELEMIKRQLWKAWEKSKEARTEQRQKKTAVGKKGASELKEQSIKRTESLPDSRYMSELLKALKQIAELLGYQAANKLDISFDQLTDNQVDDILTKLIENGSK